MRVAVQQSRQLAICVAARGVRDVGVCGQHRFQPRRWLVPLVANLRELPEVFADLAFVPGE